MEYVSDALPPLLNVAVAVIVALSAAAGTCAPVIDTVAVTCPDDSGIFTRMSFIFAPVLFLTSRRPYVKPPVV